MIIWEQQIVYCYSPWIKSLSAVVEESVIGLYSRWYCRLHIVYQLWFYMNSFSVYFLYVQDQD